VLIDLNIKLIGMDRSYSQSLPSTLVNCSTSVSDDGSPRPVRGGGIIVDAPRPHEEQTVTASLPWHMRALVLLTLFSELSAAAMPAEFAVVRQRLQQEWSFDGGFVS